MADLRGEIRKFSSESTYWYIIALTEKLQDILNPLAYLCSSKVFKFLFAYWMENKKLFCKQ